MSAAQPLRIKSIHAAGPHYRGEIGVQYWVTRWDDPEPLAIEPARFDWILRALRRREEADRERLREVLWQRSLAKAMDDDREESNG